MKPRWLLLYEKGKEKQLKRNKQPKLECEYTFKPKINKKSKYLTRHIKTSVFERLYKCL